MTSAQTGPNYDARIRRAKHLGAIYSFASEVMTFYAHLALFQKRLYANLPEIGPASATPANLSAGFRSQLDLALLLPHFPDLLALLQSVGPAPVVETARQLALQGPAAWIAFLTDYWSAVGSAGHSVAAERIDAEAQQPASEVLTEFLLRVFVQPYAEFLAARCPVPHLEAMPSRCPICGSGPLLGVLRPEGDGGRRSLVCSFCLHEWNFRRILCPFCGEEAENKLPVYIAEQLPHIRVEACDTCKSCLRTIDLTKDGHAIPIVDDLAAIPLTLWASEHGYSRPHPNILAT
jgi:formate dehydrogenase maturation protein FdhE